MNHPVLSHNLHDKDYVIGENDDEGMSDEVLEKSLHFVHRPLGDASAVEAAAGQARPAVDVSIVLKVRLQPALAVQSVHAADAAGVESVVAAAGVEAKQLAVSDALA